MVRNGNRGVIARSFDADRLNDLVNHPAIRPYVGGDPEAYLDLSHLIADDKNIALLGDHGGFFATWTAPHTYEVHTFILPEGRGRAAYELAREGRDYMTSHGANHLWTRVQRGAENVKRFTLAAGFTPCGEQVLDLGAGPTTYDLFQWRAECP
jgi:hypothetical protein